MARLFLSEEQKHYWLLVHQLAAGLLMQNRRRMIANFAVIVCSSALMMLQGNLLWGFFQAGKVAMNAIGGQVWVVPKGVRSFDFGTYFARDYQTQLYAHPAVQKVTKVVSGVAGVNSLGGVQHAILLVGVDELAHPGGEVLHKLRDYGPYAYIADAGALDVLGIDSVPAQIEINRQRAEVVATMPGISTFMGGPYGFAPFSAANQWLGAPNSHGSFLALQIDPRAEIGHVISQLQSKFPAVDIKAQADFARQSSWFWMMRTGAGSALVVAGILGFFVGLLVISQTIYSVALEKEKDLATIRALGGDALLLRRVTAWQATCLAMLGGLVGLVLCIPATGIVRWLLVDWADWYGSIIAISLALMAVMSWLASRGALRFVQGVDPATVFRR